MTKSPKKYAQDNVLNNKQIARRKHCDPVKRKYQILWNDIHEKKLNRQAHDGYQRSAKYL